MAARSLLSRRRALSSALSACCLTVFRNAAAADFTMSEIAPDVYFRRGADSDATKDNDNAIANIGFIVGRDSIAVIDPGGCLADGRRLRENIRAVSGLPIRYVILSHAHPDHIFGAGAFLEENPIFVGHGRLPHALAQRGAFYQKGLEGILGIGHAGPVVVPTLLVQDRTEIDLGGRLLTLAAHGAAHTDNDLSVLDHQTGGLLLADLLFVERVPALDGSLKGWLKELATLKAIDAHYAVPGHGPIKAQWPAAAAAEERYLQTLLRETREAVAKNIGVDRAAATVALSERGKWKLFDDYNGRNVTEAYKELEWE